MVDIRSLISQIPMEPGYVPAPPEPDLSVIQRLMGLPQTLRAVGQNMAVGAASLPVGVYKGFGNPAAGEAAMSQFQQEYGYTPTNPAAQRQLQGLGEFLQQLETEYKIPPMISPSQLPSRAATAGSAMQLGRIGTRMTGQAQDLARDLVRDIQTTPPTGSVTMGTKVAESPLENPNFRTWFAGSDAAKESGEPITLYHATTHDFDTFSLNRANPENHYGKGFYLTDSIDDANLNYAGIGPDLEIKIELRTERLADELMDMTPEDVADMARELNVDESLIDLAKIEESGASPELIREIATKELTTHGGAVMPVYARLRNPVKVGTKDETTFRIDTEFDDDGDLVSESGNGIDLYNSLNDVGREYGIPEQQIGEVWAKISNEMIDDDITAGRVDEIIRNNVYDIYTPDGEYAGPGQFIADVFRDMGFDGIKMDAGKYFGPRQGAMGTKLKGMEGVEEATHYILFEPTQIKSALGNEGTYSLTDPSILRGVGVGGAGLLGAGMMQEEEQF
jgi:hypothetical protein